MRLQTAPCAGAALGAALLSLLAGCASTQYCHVVGASSTNPKQLATLFEDNHRTPLVLYGPSALVCPCDGRQMSPAEEGSGASSSRDTSGRSGTGGSQASSASGSSSDGASRAAGDSSAKGSVADARNQRSWGGVIGASLGEMTANSHSGAEPNEPRGTSCHLEKPNCPTYVVHGVGSDEKPFAEGHPSVFDGREIHELQSDRCVR